jgi:1-phosphatidylinositol-4-phosphate 5-kinase
MEHFWRGLSNPKDQVSAVPPQGYGDRFFKFISGLVKSPEEAARDKEARERANAEGISAKATDNDVVDRARAQAEVSGGNEGDRPTKSLGAVGSPSAERTGGAAGAVLPVVEEAGEGSSTGARSRSQTASLSDNGRQSECFDSVADRRASRSSRETAAADELPGKPPQPRSGLENGTAVLQPLNLATTSLVQKHEQDEIAIRVARVSS